MKPVRSIFFCLAVIATIPGCASQPVTTTNLTEAIQAKVEVPEDTLLDVSVRTFDTGLAAENASATAPIPEEKEGVYPEVRKSESRYLPVRLAETMQSTGNWGAVRVVPRNVDSAEILVTGKIIESTGKDLVLEIQVQDASGAVWFEKKYKEVADLRAYQSGEIDAGDPFQHVYNQIANDILAERRKLSEAELREIRKIAELRFAADLAPDPFENYLEKNRKGEYEVSRLPAEGDPMVERIARIRERDYMLIDTLNEQYAGFYSQMERPYSDWRAFSYEEQVALEELRRQARMRKIVGAVAIIGSNPRARREWRPGGCPRHRPDRRHRGGAERYREGSGGQDPRRGAQGAGAVFRRRGLPHGGRDRR